MPISNPYNTVPAMSLHTKSRAWDGSAFCVSVMRRWRKASQVRSLRTRLGRSAGLALEKLGDFTRLGVATDGLLAEDQFIIHDHFKSPLARGNQGQGLDGVGVVLEQFVRQTDGAGRVVSLHAVFDTHLHFVHH